MISQSRKYAKIFVMANPFKQSDAELRSSEPQESRHQLNSEMFEKLSIDFPHSISFTPSSKTNCMASADVKAVKKAAARSSEPQERKHHSYSEMFEK
jgi:hypothetical protein